MKVKQHVKFAIVPEWVIEHPHLSGNAKTLYALFARYSNSEGECRPSRATLAKRLHCTVKSIDRWKDELIEVGALVILAKGGSDPRLANVYALRQTAPELTTGESLATPESLELATEESPQRESRNEKQSSPTDELSLVRSAGDLVREAVDTLREAGVQQFGKSYTSKLGGITKRLLKDYDFEIVQAATIHAMQKGRGPEAIPNLCIEIQRLKPAQRVRRYGIGLTPEEILERARAS